jgi:chromate transporter
LIRPRSPADIFFVFNRLALQGFGGVIAVAQRELVERQRWLTREQFVELLSVGQMLPGPNVVNLSLMFGDRHFGWRGAMAALAGMLALPLVIVLMLASVYGRFDHLPAVQGAMRGMVAVAAGLMLATAIKLLPTLRSNALGVPLCATFAATSAVFVAVWHWPLAAVVLGLGTVSVGVAWTRLRP